MSFILSWRGYFSRKGWDPQLWAKANGIETYDQCAKRISKMCVCPPTKEEYLSSFSTRKTDDFGNDIQDDHDASVSKIEKVPEKFVKSMRPESKSPAKAKTPTPTTKTKRPTRKRSVKKPAEISSSDSGSGTSSIIDSVKKKTATRKTRSRKNVKSS